MDTTEEYTGMCREAKEIQTRESNNNWRDDDICAILDDDSDKIKIICYQCELEYHKCFEKGKVLWLPRQDQLQEMLKEPYPDSFERFWNEFLQWEFFEMPKYFSHCTSMEQLWLAYFMHEKFGKIWDRKDGKWKKETK